MGWWWFGGVLRCDRRRKFSLYDEGVVGSGGVGSRSYFGYRFLRVGWGGGSFCFFCYL